MELPTVVESITAENKKLVGTRDLEVIGDQENGMEDILDKRSVQSVAVEEDQDILLADLRTANRERKKYSRKKQNNKRVGDQEGKSKGKRGRPKGSKNKPKGVLVADVNWSVGADCMMDLETRTNETWLLGKELGLVYKGDEEVAIQGLREQIKNNHSSLFE